jgi:nickel-dependent lactate racemase
MPIIKLPYYTGHLEINVAAENLKAVLAPPAGKTAGRPGPAGAVIQALAAPSGTPPLCELAAGKLRILIITSDHTRAMPSRLTLPLLLGQIRNGNPAAEVTILIATGLHRRTTETEQRMMFGDDIVNREKIVVHDAYDEDKMRYIGDLPSGGKCFVNALALEADLLVTEGFVEPHFFAGFSGGRKSILPGIASAQTICENHCAWAIAHPASRIGIMEGNIINADMEYAAARVGVDFSLNVALDDQKEIIAATAGALSEAHAAACAFVRERAGAERVRGEIVVTSNGGYPLDQNLYQSPKAMITARECAVPGGVIIMIASCVDGLGGEEFGRMMLSGSPTDVLAAILNKPARETVPEQWNAQILCEIMTRHPVILVSTYLDPALTRQIGMIPAATPNEALAIAYRMKSPTASVVVIPDGVAPIVR